jgi:uncharacterized protein
MSVNYPPSCPPHLSLSTKLKPSRRRKLRGSKPNWRRRLQYCHWRLVRMQGKPEAIARGLACGVFAGLFPIFGFQTIIGVFLAFIFRGNKILAAAGTWISNPLTYVPIYAFNFHMGKWLLNKHDDFTDVSLQSWQQVQALGSEIILTLFVGCFAVGLVCSILSYVLGVWSIRRIRISYQLRSHRRQLHTQQPSSF